MQTVYQATKWIDAKAFVLGLILLGSVATLGCESSAAADEEMLFSLEKQDWVEIDLGHFTISVLIADDPTRQPDLNSYQESVSLNYQLHCLVGKRDETRVKAYLEERKGELSDEIIRTCRHANLVDLADPELQLIRSQLRDYTEEAIGPGTIKRFVFSDVALERF
ncbi:hypothetical protein AB1L30_20810 [Bremerella sp. JC817]|uniref:hypothetical protein n=1 Tax=Bremerella sp. JC817 TaxID=3231756 RepID=UPI0034579B3C